MRLVYFFIILAVLQLSVWVFMLALSFDTQSVAFYFVEGATVVNILFLFYFYRKVMKPIDSVTTGVDLLKEQDFNSMLVKRGHYEADKIVDLFNDMLSRLRSERLKNREQNHLLNLLIECSPMGVLMMNAEGRIVLSNRAAVKMLGSDDLHGKTLEELVSPIARVLSRLQADGSDTMRAPDAMIYRVSRHAFVDSGVSHPFYLMESLTDEMMRAEKNAYEKVIRIMAHEVNNTVAGISSAFDVMDSVLEQMGDADDVREMMRVCVARNAKMSAFVSRLSNVVKVPEAVLREEELNHVVESCSLLFQAFCNEHNIRLHINAYHEDVPVQMDVPLFEQALQNIVKNAVESIEQDGDIFITIGVEKGKPTLEVADTGKGLSSEAENMLFSPFFTTKSNGQGVGLMLIREILTRHHCLFSLTTDKKTPGNPEFSELPGDNKMLTRFRIIFP